MEKRTKIEIGIAITVLLTLFFLLWFFLRPQSSEPVVVQDDDQSGVLDDSKTVVDDRVTEVDSRTTQSPPSVIARSFVERLGSYSTDVDYANVDDIKSLATPVLQSTLDSIVVEARQTNASTYYGVSTHVITVETVSEDENTAILSITTQRIESFDSPGNTSTRYQDIELELVKLNEKWLVDTFTWGE